MAVLLEKFLEWLAVKNYAERTVAIRRTCVGYFIELGRAAGHRPRPSEVTRPILERYQRYLFHYRKQNGDPLSVRTQVQPPGVRCGRGSSGWPRQNHILYNPAGEMEMPKLEFRLPKAVLTAREAEQVIALAEREHAAGPAGPCHHGDAVLDRHAADGTGEPEASTTWTGSGAR